MQKSLRDIKTWLNRSRTKEKLHYRSLFLFTKTNRFRKFLHALSCSWQFEYFILLAILSSCVLLTLQGPKPIQNLNDPFVLADLVLNGIFAAEAIIKIIAHGFVLHPGAYLRNRWNFFDFVVVVSGALSDAIAMFSAQKDRSVSLKAIRLFRVFRPLRLIAKSNNLKVVLDTIIKSFSTIIHVLLFIFLIITLYAITGLELFSEAITIACVNSTTGLLLYPITSCDLNTPASSACSLYNATCSASWKGDIDGISSFSNILIGMLTVIQVITMEDWVFVSYDIADVASPYVTWIFFVSLILFGSYFALDLLMGVLGNQYLRTKQFAKTMKVIDKHREKILMDAKASNENIKDQSVSIVDHLGQKWRRARDCLHLVCKPFIERKGFFYISTVIVISDVIISTVYAHVRDTDNKVPEIYLILKSGLLIWYIEEIFLVGFGCGFQALENGYYIYNTLVSVVACVEVVFALSGNTTYVGLSILRALTLIEVFKQTRFWGQLKTIMSSFFETIKGVASLIILLFIVLTNYALLGNQLFGDTTQNRDSMGTFDTFPSSLLLSFVLLTGDNWKSFMDREIENSNNTFTKVMAVVFYLSFVVVGNFILINVFLGIIVDNLTSDFEEQHEDEFEEEKRERMKRLTLKSVGLIGKMYKNEINKNNKKKSSNKVSSDDDCTVESFKMGSQTSDNQEHDTTHDDGAATQTMATFMNDTVKNTLVQFDIEGENISRILDEGEEFRVIKQSMQVGVHTRARARAFSMLINPEISDPIPNHKSFCLFRRDNPFRRNIFFLVTSSKFTLFICTCIVISSLLMAIDDPLKRDPKMAQVIQIIDYVLTVFFTIEIILKSIAYGFLFGHNRCYLRNAMNILDAVVIAVSVFNICMDLLGYTQSVQLHVLRVVRLVRMLKVSSQLKCVINCLLHSLKKIFYFLVLYLLILFVYSIVGVHLYKGGISHCSDTAYMTRSSCNHHNETWNSNDLSFDNLGAGMTTLFVLSTMDDWFVFLIKLINIEEKDDITAVIFIVTFIMIMSFVMLNVFIGFVIVLFHKEREKDEKFIILDKLAQDCIRTALSENPRQTEQPAGYFQEKIWALANTAWFQNVGMLLILLNTGFIMTKHAQQSAMFTIMQRWSNIVFTVLFTIEIAIKLLAFTWRVLLYDYWVTFDAVVIFGSWVDIILDELKVNFINLSIFRLFRVARLAQLVGKGGNLRELFNTFLKSMKCVPSIACLIALLLYFYAVLGMNIFGKIRLDDSTAINRNTNFQSFPQAVLVLIRVTTLDAWHEIMLTCADIESKNCADSNENCGTYFSFIYFASFVFMCSYIMTNLFLAFIMDNFVYLTHDISTLDARQIHRFTAIWSTFDRKGLGSIRKKDLVPLLMMIDPPLGCGQKCPKRMIYSKLLKIRVPIEPDGRVRFSELLLSLVLELLHVPTENNETMRDDMHVLFPTIEEEVLDRVLPLSYDPRIFNSEEKDFYEDCASHIISGFFKSYTASINIARKLATSHKLKKPFKHLMTPLQKRLPSVDLTAVARSKSDTNLSSSSANRT